MKQSESSEIRIDPQTGDKVEFHGEYCYMCGGELAFIAGFTRHVANGSMLCPKTVDFSDWPGRKYRFPG